MLEVSEVEMTYQPLSRPWRWLVDTATDEPVRALRGISMSVKRGEVVGLVGPNGAGKSTLLRSITGLLIPTAGQVTLDGDPVEGADRHLRERFGLFLPEERSFYWRLTGRQNLEYFAAMAGMSRPAAQERVRVLMEERALAGRDKAVFGYSSGMLAQLGLARALLHEPPLLILDEPTRSLDPLAGAELCRQVRALAADGTRGVLLASHRLDEVVSACDRVLALVDGRIRWEGTAADIAGDPAGLGRRLRSLVVAVTEGQE